MMLPADPTVQQSLLRDVIETAFSGICLVGPDLKFRYANPRFCEMVGYSDIELSARTVFSVTHPADAEVDQSLSMEVMAGVRPSYEITKTLLSKAGKNVVVRVRVTPLKTTDGDFLLFVMKIVPPEVSQVPPEIMVPKFNEKEFYTEFAQVAFDRITNKRTITVIGIVVAGFVTYVASKLGVELHPPK